MPEKPPIEKDEYVAMTSGFMELIVLITALKSAFNSVLRMSMNGQSLWILTWIGTLPKRCGIMKTAQSGTTSDINNAKAMHLHNKRKVFV